MSFYRAGRSGCRVSFDCGDQILTEQAHKDACNINNILRQYQRTGQLNHLNHGSPQYGELPDSIDYQEALNTMISANDAFNALPAALRDRYGNDPAKFLAALTDPKQADFLRAAGVLNPLPDPPATPPPAPSPEPAGAA